MQNEKLKKFTDFFVKYRRYFCAAVLFVILVVILVKCTGPQKDQKETQNGTQGVTQTTEYQEIGKLQKDADPELVTLMENYYAAYAGGDTDSLEMIAQPLSDNEKSYITTFSEYYEDYQNITCYSTKGATDDSYLVSVCYDLKFKGVDTPAPGMDFFYVERDGKGNLIINNIYSAYNFNFLDQDLDANLYSLILAYEKSDEVVALQKEVQTSYNEAVKSDEKLANMVGGTLRNAMAKWRETIVSNTETQTTETESQTQETQTTETKQQEETQKKEETQKTEETQTTETKKQEETQKKEETQKTEETQTTEPTEKKEDTQKSDSKKSTGTVKTKDICNVRKSPSTDGELLGKVDIGVELKKLGTEGDWTKVKFQGETGYVKSEFVKEVSSKSGSGKGTVKTKDICNVRKTASTDGELLGKVDAGVKLKKLGTKGEWTKVKFQGKTGYIKSDLLKTVK